MKSSRTVMIFSGLSHAMAWAAFLGMAFSPSFYQGISTTPIGPDGSGGESVSVSASIIAVNGWWALIPLLVPVALTAVGLLAAVTWEHHEHRNKVILWISTGLLMAFCGLAIFSVGIFYLPAALSLLATAIFTSFVPRGTPTPP